VNLTIEFSRAFIFRVFSQIQMHSQSDSDANGSSQSDSDKNGSSQSDLALLYGSSQFFLQHDGEILCEVLGNKRRSPLTQGGLEIPCKYTFIGKKKTY